MRFRVIGARRDSGEDVNLLVEARDEPFVQRWANQHGILWTSIVPAPKASPPAPVTGASPPPLASNAVPSEPQTPSAAKPKPYEAEKDGVIWLIGAIGVLLCLLVSSRQIGIFDASQLGATLGAAVGAFIFIFLFGLIGSKIAGNHARRSRIGFTIGAALALTLFIVGEMRIRKSREEEVQALAQRLVPPRGRINTPVSGAPTSVSQSTGPIAGIGASEADDVKLLLAEVEKIQQEARTRGEAFQQKMNAIAIGDLTQPRNFDTLEKILAVKSKMLQMRELIDAQDKLVDDMFRTMPGRISSLPINSTLKLETLRGYESTAAHSQEVLRRVTQSERNFTIAVTDLADFYQSHLGRFHLDGNTVVFDDATDVAAYNGILIRIQLLRKEAGQLMAAQEQMRDQASDDLQKLKKLN
jgi:hypothetical protein